MSPKSSHLSVMLLFVSAAAFLVSATDLSAQDIPAVQLQAPDLTRGKLLMQALQDRQSRREFSPQDLPLDVLSNLLWAAGGVNRPESGRLTAPTASDSREISIYVAMKQGLFRYDPQAHRLDPVLARDIRAQAGIQDFTQVAPVDLIYVADLSKLRNNQNFYSATDTGFVSQNVYLFCASEGLATVVLGWVDKPALEKLMGLKEGHKVILVQPVGYPQ